MTLQRQAPHTRSRWTALIIAVTTLMALSATAVLAAPPGISLEQCRNGSASNPNDCEQLGGSTGWVNGNVGASQGHLLEGYSIPYRAVMTNLPLNTNITVTLGYDITHSGKHAIDYLTHYDRLESHTFFGHPAEDVFPTSGFETVLSADTDTEPITNPGNLSAAASTGFNNLPGAQKVMTIFGGTINDGSFTYVNAGDPNAAQSEARVALTFQAKSSTVILAWGGHIARGDQWDGASASEISGSPYHMRVKAWTLGNVGNQDRSLSAGAVFVAEATITTAPSGTFRVTLNDTATVSGDNPSGTVEFRLYDTAANCLLGGTTVGTGGLLYKETVALSGGSATTTGTGSGSNVVTTAGVFVWSAEYGGDGGNTEADSLCAESATVTAPTFVNDPPAP